MRPRGTIKCIVSGDGRAGRGKGGEEFMIGRGGGGKGEQQDIGYREDLRRPIPQERVYEIADIPGCPNRGTRFAG